MKKDEKPKYIFYTKYYCPSCGITFTDHKQNCGLNTIFVTADTLNEPTIINTPREMIKKSAQPPEFSISHIETEEEVCFASLLKVNRISQEQYQENEEFYLKMSENFDSLKTAKKWIQECCFKTENNEMHDYQGHSSRAMAYHVSKALEHDYYADDLAVTDYMNTRYGPELYQSAWSGTVELGKCFSVKDITTEKKEYDAFVKETAKLAKEKLKKRLYGENNNEPN